jgi:NAD(P)H-hydrate repair Nnr-like enzyme with NAD(P)H-hydrate dehydratase domain
MAQNLSTATSAAIDIAELAVCLHAAAADLLVKDKTRGLLASDVVENLAVVLQ